MPRGRTPDVAAGAVEEEGRARKPKGGGCGSSAGRGRIWTRRDGRGVRRNGRLNSDPDGGVLCFSVGERPSVPREHPCRTRGVVWRTRGRRGDPYRPRWRERLKHAPRPGWIGEKSVPCGGSSTSPGPSDVLDHRFATGAGFGAFQRGRDLSSISSGWTQGSGPIQGEKRMAYQPEGWWPTNRSQRDERTKHHVP